MKKKIFYLSFKNHLLSANRTAKYIFKTTLARQQFSTNHIYFVFFEVFFGTFADVFRTIFAHEVNAQLTIKSNCAIQVFKTTLARQWYAKSLVHEQIYIYCKCLKFKKLSVT
jgi:hypothetical protein